MLQEEGCRVHKHLIAAIPQVIERLCHQAAHGQNCVLHGSCECAPQSGRQMLLAACQQPAAM